MFTFEGEEIKPTIFPDKTSQVWKIDKDLMLDVGKNRDACTIFWEFEHEAELIHICQLADLYKALFPRKRLILHAPYCPYARQDKYPSNNATFALRTFCSIVELWFDELIVFDIHNEEAFAYSNEECRYTFTFKNIRPDNLIDNLIGQYNIDVVLYPDKSAGERYTLNKPQSILTADKHRVPETGIIDRLIVDGAEIVAGKRVLVVDDICDGGFTFCLAAEALRPYTPHFLALYTSHGIYSKGKKILLDAGYHKLFTRFDL